MERCTRKYTKYKRFPSIDQLLRWSVFLAERHNNVYKSSQIIEAHRSQYKKLEESLKDWTDWDVVCLEIALTELEFGFPEFYADVDAIGGLPSNKFWIYSSDNKLSQHINHVLRGFTSIGILEQHPDECQWRWKKCVH